MMSVPAINSVLPSSGSQPSKISTSPTANPSVSPIGLSVSPKLSVIPQISTSPSKPPIGVNHSSIQPLSLVFENKVLGSQAQSKPIDKPKDLSPAKPTSNGVELSTKPTQLTPQTQPSSTIPSCSKPEEAVEQTDRNHSEERIPSTSNESSENQDNAHNETSTQKVATEKVEESSKNISNEVGSEIEKKPNEVKENSEDTITEAKSEKKETKSQSQAAKRKREQKPEEQKEQPESDKKPRRIRSQVLPYQSPLPELTTFINKSLKEKDGSQKSSEEKLIVFYKNEFLAVRNADDGFYLCQTLQNVYRTSHRIRIRWLSQVKESSSDEGDIYTPDFYDLADFECILTSVALSKKDKNKYKLRKVELERIENILKRALDVEKGVVEKPSITEEHPDGIDLSLYKDESQLQKPKKEVKRKAVSPVKETTKKARKDDSGEIGTRRSPRKAKPKNLSKNTKKVTKTSTDKVKVVKRGVKSESKSLKAMDQLKVSPPNEKARVVAKVLRKVDIVPTKVSPKKQAKAKTAKRSQEIAKNKKKKPLKGTKKPNQKEIVKEETAQSHRERRQGKNKYSNNKNKKN